MKEPIEELRQPALPRQSPFTNARAARTEAKLDEGQDGGVGFEAEIIISVEAMQLRAAVLFSEMIFGLISGYRVEMDRSVHPAEFHITTWKSGTGT